MLFLASVLACGSPEDEALDPCANAPTWDGFAQGFFLSWCTSCHGGGLKPGFRSNAPVGVDFDTYEQATAYASVLEVRVVGEDADMPPVAEPTSQDLALLEQWLMCGLPE